MEDLVGISGGKSTSDITPRAVDSKVGNGAQLAILDRHQNDSSTKKRVAECGPLAKGVVLMVVAVISAMTAAGVIYTALNLTSHHRIAEFEGTEAPMHWAEDEHSSKGSVHSTGNTIVSSSGGVLPPPDHRRGWRPVARDDWGSWTSVAATPHLLHPIGLVIVTHTAGQSCETVAGCRNKMRDLQDYSVGQLRKPDIPYNFLVGRDGNAYEGVGWDRESNFSRKYNNCSISIAYVGNYVHLEPTPQQLKATENILTLGVELKKLTPNYIVVAHNLTANTLSPGSSVYKQIAVLPHFTNDDSLLPF